MTFHETQRADTYLAPVQHSSRSIGTRRNVVRVLVLATATILATAPCASAQARNGPSPELVAQRNATENELESIAIIERKLMVPMRDGKRMATDVYRPKDTSKKYPTIFGRTP